MTQVLCEDSVKLVCQHMLWNFWEPAKVGSATYTNTHTVNCKRLTNKWLLLFQGPVALTLFLQKKKIKHGIVFILHTAKKYICIYNNKQKVT